MTNELVDLALKKLVGSSDSTIMQLDPKFTWVEEMDTGDKLYGINASNWKPEDILGCWIYQEEKLKECSLEQCLEFAKQADLMRIERISFSIVEQQFSAQIIWIVGLNKMRRALMWGVYFYERKDNQWLEIPEIAHVWRS